MPGWEPGKAFEYLVVRAFELEGAAVHYPLEVSIETTIVEQVDGIVHVPGISALLECKDHRDAVSVEPIAKLRNQLARRPSSTVGVVFSRSGFTSPARTLARYMAPQTILLWHGSELEFALHRGIMIPGLILKYRSAVERAVPDHFLRSEDIS